MKRNSIIFIIILVAFVNVFQGIAQRTVSYEILRNNPLNENINNLSFNISPVAVDFALSHGYLGYKLGCHYNLNNKALFDVEFRHSYVKDWYSVFDIFDIFDGNESLITTDPVGGAKRNFNFDLTGQYLISGFVKNTKTRFVVNDKINYQEYIKIKTDKYFAFPIRFGYSYSRFKLKTEAFGKEAFSYQGIDISSSSSTPEQIQGATMSYLGTINLGLGVMVIDDIKIRLGFNEDNFRKIKEAVISTVYYADLLIPVSHRFEDISVTRKEAVNGQLVSTTKRYNVNDNTPIASYGIKAGMRVQGLMMKDNATTIELGYLPQPGTLSSRFFIQMTIEYSISKKL